MHGLHGASWGKWRATPILHRGRNGVNVQKAGGKDQSPAGKACWAKRGLKEKPQIHLKETSFRRELAVT